LLISVHAVVVAGVVISLESEEITKIAAHAFPFATVMIASSSDSEPVCAE
jgi:hypothetical protein